MTPHADRSPVEHGFVSLLPAGDGAVRAVWLDGRKLAEADGGAGEAGGHPGGEAPGAGGPAAQGAPVVSAGAPGSPSAAGPEMTLRSAVVRPDGTVEERALLDGRVCDCCQTSAAATSAGPLVVYRDRSPGEVRDMAVVRLLEGGWSEPAAVHADGWELEACPVNGPAADARGDTVAVAWFTAADRRPRVRVAHSTDAGASFGPPVAVDAGDPVGRVDAVLLPGGDALVSWVERVAGGGAAALRVRRVGIGGDAGPAADVSAASAARAGGFPRMALRGDRVLFAWTDPSGPGRVRVAEGRLGGS